MSKYLSHTVVIRCLLKPPHQSNITQTAVGNDQKDAHSMSEALAPANSTYEHVSLPGVQQSLAGQDTEITTDSDPPAVSRPC